MTLWRNTKFRRPKGGDGFSITNQGLPELCLCPYLSLHLCLCLCLDLLFSLLFSFSFCISHLFLALLRSLFSFLFLMRRPSSTIHIFRIFFRDQIVKYISLVFNDGTNWINQLVVLPPTLWTRRANSNKLGRTIMTIRMTWTSCFMTGENLYRERAVC